MKKKILIINLILSIIIGGYIFLQLPITKLPTENAIKSMEEKFIRTDLNEEEKDSFQFLKGWILGNQKSALRCNWNSRSAGLIMCIIILISNSVMLYFDRKK